MAASMGNPETCGVSVCALAGIERVCAKEHRRFEVDASVGRSGCRRKLTPEAVEIRFGLRAQPENLGSAGPCGYRFGLNGLRDRKLILRESAAYCIDCGQR